MLLKKPKKVQKKRGKIRAAEFMPKDSMSQQVLQQRAERLAVTVSDKQQNVEPVNYIRFRLGANEFYGIPFSMTKEVIQDFILTPLPQMQNFVAGIINWRGLLLTVIELRKFFHLTEIEAKASHLIIVEDGGVQVGFLVDDIQGSQCFDLPKLEAPLSADGVIKTDYILGLHGGKTAILHVPNILKEVKTLGK